MLNQGCTKTPEALFRETVEQHEKIIALEADIARLREQLTWQPIETAPEQEEILGLAKNGHIYEITVDDENFYLSSFWPDDEWDCDFTHWRPIPPLPQPQEGSPMDNTLTDEVYP